MSVSYWGTVNTGSFSFKAMPVEKVADKLIKKIHAPAACQITGNYWLPYDAQLFITCGDAIRGIPEALIKTSLSDLHKALSCLFDVGTKSSNAGNNGGGLFHIVSKDDIFRKNVELLDLGEVKNMRTDKLPDDWLCSGIKTGYEKQDYDYTLGRQDFACTLEYINELKITNKVWDWICKYRADYTGVHLLHYDYVNSDTKDSTSDNDIFLILAFLINGKWQAVIGDDTWVYSDETPGDFSHDRALQMQGGGYFNILLSPHRNLNRHLQYFNSMLHKVTPKLLRYVSSTETLSNMVSDYRGNEVIEKSDEQLYANSPLLFKPLIFEFDCIIPDNLSELLGENPAGYVTFHYNNLTLKGFPIEVAGSYKNSSQKVTVVAHPDTPDNIEEILHQRLPNKWYH
ncbi:MAG: hypothetical protein LBF19_01150 [Prevotellaceae bacterium]|nr:hypothetical protein [Prevotellaceae bacterium]